MGDQSGVLARVGGRRIVLGLGGLAVAFAAAFPLYVALAARLPGLPVADRTGGGTLVVSGLVGASGLALVYGGHRLPDVDVRPDLYDVVAGWCLRGAGVMLGIVALTTLVGSVDDPVSGFVVLPALAGVAGLVMGYHDARARTRALDAEERQREAEQYSRELERYETIVETVNDGIFVVDGEGYFTMVNDAYEEMVDYDREELLGSHKSLVVADEDVDRLADEMQRAMQRDAPTTGEAATYEATLKTTSGDAVEAEATIAFLPGEADDSFDHVGVVRDVTERNERERRLEEQNERLDSFASMLAHELRNPVSVGQIYARELPGDANEEALRYVTEAFDRIEAMIDVMLVMTRGREAVPERTTVDLADTARAAWAEVDAPEATLEIAAEGTVQGDGTYTRHLFRNLLENAVEHGGSDVTVTVGDLPTGFYVADDGDGIPAGERDAVFDAGYTTASGHGGTGLGLAFVRELADAYEWDCAVTESAGGGARFEFADAVTTRPATD